MPTYRNLLGDLLYPKATSKSCQDLPSCMLSHVISSWSLTHCNIYYPNVVLYCKRHSLDACSSSQIRCGELSCSKAANLLIRISPCFTLRFGFVYFMVTFL